MVLLFLYKQINKPSIVSKSNNSRKYLHITASDLELGSNFIFFFPLRRNLWKYCWVNKSYELNQRELLLQRKHQSIFTDGANLFLVSKINVITLSMKSVSSSFNWYLIGWSCRLLSMLEKTQSHSLLQTVIKLHMAITQRYGLSGTVSSVDV